MTPDKIKLKIEGAISLIDLKSLLKAQGEYFLDDGFSHKLIHIKTNEDLNDSLYTKAICIFASNFMENKCLEKFQKDHTDDLCSFIKNLRDISEIAVLHGKLFEMWSHAKICKEKTFQDFSNIKDINIREGIYYQPVTKNYQSIDSYIHPNQLLQITIADRHRV
ncbi:6641_t:CDS:2, partial [Funneliformis caledonium]